MARLYSDLANRWHELSSPEDYAEEAEIYRRVLDENAARPVRTVLELGCGGGNNASHLKAHYELTLVDLSPEMLAQSRRLNPECAHVTGDMRTVRLDGTFDAVFVQDAVMYLTTEEDLLAAMKTAAAHLAPGGLVLLVPDDTKESWREDVSSGGHGSIRYLAWSHDPDPTDSSFLTTYAYLVRDGDGRVDVVHETHTEGLFPRNVWLRLLAQADFDARALPYEHSTFDDEAGHVLFVGLRRA